MEENIEITEEIMLQAKMKILATDSRKEVREAFYEDIRDLAPFAFICDCIAREGANRNLSDQLQYFDKIKHKDNDILLFCAFQAPAFLNASSLLGSYYFARERIISVINVWRTNQNLRSKYPEALKNIILKLSKIRNHTHITDQYISDYINIQDLNLCTEEVLCNIAKMLFSEYFFMIIKMYRHSCGV
jgi:hypothetical protein